MGILAMMLKAVLLVALSMTVFMGLALGLGADLAAGSVVADCVPVARVCIFTIF